MLEMLFAHIGRQRLPDTTSRKLVMLFANRGCQTLTKAVRWQKRKSIKCSFLSEDVRGIQRFPVKIRE